MANLSAAEKTALDDSWKKMTGSKTDHGIALFLTLFGAYPDTLDFFKDFEGKSIQEISGSSNMRAHGAAVMYALGSLVDNVNDTECLKGLIRKIARNHKGRNIGKSRFEQLRGLYGDFLDTRLAGASNATVKSAWDKFLIYVNNQIEKEQA